MIWASDRQVESRSERRARRKRMRYLLLSLSLASLASAIFCLVLWHFSRPTAPARPTDPFEMDHPAVKPQR